MRVFLRYGDFVTVKDMGNHWQPEYYLFLPLLRQQPDMDELLDYEPTFRINAEVLRFEYRGMLEQDLAEYRCVDSHSNYPSRQQVI